MITPSRTISSSRLREPEVLAAAASAPVVVFDAKRDAELVLANRMAWEVDVELASYALVLANAVVELADAEPSAVALGPLGFAASWDAAERQWLLSELAVAYATSARVGSTAPIRAFISQMSGADTGAVLIGSQRDVVPAEIPETMAGLLRAR